MHLSTAPWPRVRRWFKFKSCFWLYTHAFEKWFSKCFSKAVTGFGHKVAIFGVGSCWMLITFAGILKEQLLQDNAEDLSQDCLCCSLLPAQAKSQRCPGAALLHCGWFVTGLWVQTSTQRLHLNVVKRLGRGVCFLSFPCCHGYNGVCVPSHAPSQQSHSPLCHTCPFFAIRHLLW